MNIETLKTLNNKASLDERLKLLEMFLGNNSWEAFLEEEGAYGKYEDFIKINKHLVARTDNIKIEIFSKEHPPAHFHIKIAEYESSYEIKDCKYMNGNLPRSYEKKIILRYKNGGKEKLIEKRNQTRPEHCPVGEI